MMESSVTRVTIQAERETKGKERSFVNLSVSFDEDEKF